MIRAWRYLWALPTTLVGLLILGLTLLTGGRLRWRAGVVETWGGFTRWFLERTVVRAQAMTLGHIILGRNLQCLDDCHDHERVHVHQVERWGLFFLPAYFFASLWAVLRGRHYYLDNWFEIDARRGADQAQRKRTSPYP